MFMDKILHHFQDDDLSHDLQGFQPSQVVGNGISKPSTSRNDFPPKGLETRGVRLEQQLADGRSAAEAVARWMRICCGFLLGGLQLLVGVDRR